MGLRNGDTLSGKVSIQPDLEILKDLTEVTYYLDGERMKVSKKAPFVMGGKKGFDTKDLSNGDHVLNIAYVTASGEEKLLSISFHVLNV